VNSLFVGMIAGAIGVGYFLYGKNTTKVAPMLAGVALCVYPYFFDDVLWLIVIGVALCAVPFLVDY
jgi:multisubunit Na+/H+ antiporter MnhC subunit